MEQLLAFSTEILVLAFLIITFLQSGIDKIVDWKGNLAWLKGHFSKTFLKGMVPAMLAVVLIIELVAGALCIKGVYDILVHQDTHFALYGAIMSCIALLMLLFGQRVAKDYAGALTITCYFIVAVFAVYLLSM
jgi:hypothetical protein